MIKQLFMLEVGVFLTPGDENITEPNYDITFANKYEENVIYSTSKQKLIDYGKEYVDKGVPYTYAILNYVGYANETDVDEELGTCEIQHDVSEIIWHMYKNKEEL